MSVDNSDVAHIFYVQPDIRKYRGIKNADDYLKIRSRAKRSLSDVVRKGRLSGRWNSFSTNERLAGITAFSTAIVALAAIATLIVMLL